MAELAKSNLFTTFIIIVIVIIFFYLIYKFYLKDKKENSVVLKGIHQISSLGTSIIYNPYSGEEDEHCVWSSKSPITGISSLSDYKKNVMCQHDGDFAKYTLCFWLRINNMPNNSMTPTVKHILHIGDLVNMDGFTGDTSICQPGIWLDTWTNRLLIRFYTLGRDKKMIHMVQINKGDFDKQIGSSEGTNCYQIDNNTTPACNSCKDGGQSGGCRCNTCFSNYTTISLDPRSNKELKCSNICQNNKLCTMAQTTGDKCNLYTNSGLDYCTPTDPTKVGKFSESLWKSVLERGGDGKVSNCGTSGDFIHKKINTMNVQAAQNQGGNTGFRDSSHIAGEISENHVDDQMTCRFMNQWPSTPHNGYLTSIRYHTDNDTWTTPFSETPLSNWVNNHNNYLSMNPYYNYRILTCQDEGLDIENVPFKRWFHLAITTQPGGGATGGVSEIYINGKLLKSKVYRKSEPPVYSNPPQLALGIRNPQQKPPEIQADTTVQGDQIISTSQKIQNTLIEYFGHRNLFIGLNSVIDTTGMAPGTMKAMIDNKLGGSQLESQIADIYYFCKILSPDELAELYTKGPVMSGWNRFLNKLKNMKGWISIGIQVGDGPMHSAMLGKSNYGKKKAAAPLKIISQAD
jgi:hypothetical protein